MSQANQTDPDSDPFSEFLTVKDLCVHFPERSPLFGQPAEPIRAVDGISFSVPRGKTVGLVGESGSGKTTTGRAIVRLAPVTSGRIYFDGTDLTALSNRAFFPFRKRIQMIFQDPYNSLNPRMTIEQVIGEPLDIHFPSLSKTDRAKRISSLLEDVGLPASAANRFPHEFSGGQRQRIGIARTIAVEPELIICDEPVSALDVSVQAQIINLLTDLQRSLGLSFLFIAHDLAVVEHVSDHVLVMTEGKIVESAEPESLYKAPQHPYTKKLLDAIPSLTFAD